MQGECQYRQKLASMTSRDCDTGHAARQPAYLKVDVYVLLQRPLLRLAVVDALAGGLVDEVHYQLQHRLLLDAPEGTVACSDEA